MSQPKLDGPVYTGAVVPDVPQTDQGDTRVRFSASPLSVEEPVKKLAAVALFKRRRRTHRFSCKARGVPDNHNASSAYVDVPPDTAHGSILVCSHPACCDSGRKFRWCEVCGVPVAKRNFGKRHAHGILMAPQLALGEERLEDDGSSSQSPKRQRLNTLGCSGEVLKLRVRKKSSSKVPTTVIMEPAPSVTDRTITAASTETTSNQLTAQERQWLDLFRATEGDFLSWMEAVVETSELKTSDTMEEENIHEARDEGNTEEEHHEDASVWDMQRIHMVDDYVLGELARVY